MNDGVPLRPFLPAILFDLARDLGLPKALRLGDAFGGRRVRVAKKPRTEHPIALACGGDVLTWLCRHFGGETLLVPMGASVARARRMATIARLTAEGFSVDDIARQLRCHRSTVRRARRYLRGRRPEMLAAAGEDAA